MSFTGKSDLTSIQAITNDGFWIDASMQDLITKYRIPAEYDNDTIKWGLSLAVIRINEKLERVKQVILAMPYSDFDAYLNAHSHPVVGSELLQVHYEAAIYSYAKALLLQQFATMNRREIAENQAKESAQTEQYWLDESEKSVAAILRAFFPDDDFSSTANVHVSLI